MAGNELFVRAGLAAFNDDALDAFLALVSPGARFYPADGFPDLEPVYEGRDAIGVAMKGWREPWDQLRIERETLDDDGDVVVFDVRWIGERAGAPPVEMPMGFALKIRAGQIVVMAAAATAADAREKLLRFDADHSMATGNAANLRRFLEEEFADIRAYIETLKRGAADMSLFAPDVEYEDSNLPDHVGEHYRGVEGLIRAGERWLEGADWITVALEQVVGDGERVVSIHRLRYKATHLDREFEQPLAYVWTFRDELIVHFASIREPDEALELAGLSKSS